jgi:hypothetical protein
VRRLAIAGALLELAATKAMEMRLGQLLGEPYRQGAAGRFTRLAKGCTGAGSWLVALGARRRPGSTIGDGLLLAASLFERLAVYRAGLSRRPTRSTPLCHNASLPRALAAKRRRVRPGAESPSRRHSAGTAKGSTGSLGASRRRLVAQAARLRSPSR